jgi:hypothetical protein
MAKVHFPSQGLRAFLPKPEMMTRPRNFTDLKNKVSAASFVFRNIFFASHIDKTESCLASVCCFTLGVSTIDGFKFTFWA